MNLRWLQSLEIAWRDHIGRISKLTRFLIFNGSSFVSFPFNVLFLMLFHVKRFLRFIFNFTFFFSLLTVCRVWFFITVSLLQNCVVDFRLSHLHSSGRRQLTTWFHSIEVFLLVGILIKTLSTLGMGWFAWRIKKLLLILFLLANSVTHNTLLSLCFQSFRRRVDIRIIDTLTTICFNFPRVLPLRFIFIFQIRK